jgi:glucose-6-phosphate isomerase, archaeal
MNTLDIPFGFDVLTNENRPARYDNHYQRRLSGLRGLFSDGAAYQAELAKADPVVYEVYEIRRPEIAGELLHGLSVVHPGKVGREFYMTKGHYHAVRDTAEVYYCLKGRGLMLMENEAASWAAEEFGPGRLVYVPPRWAHRSMNLSPDEDLITLFVYPGHAGHDYGAIEERGFRKLVMCDNGAHAIVDNPAWK